MKKRGTMYSSHRNRCAYDGCVELTGFHSTYTKLDGTPSGKPKQYCSYHRTGYGKDAVDDLKIRKGCSNVDGHHGFICKSPITHPTQLDVNHKDGNRNNNAQENLEFLCKNCHSRVTHMNKHHLNRYDYVNLKFTDFFYYE